jgi:hypothetical protein
VIGDQIHQQLGTPCPCLFDQLVDVVQVAKQRVDPPIIGHVVTAVVERRDIPGIDPDGVDAESMEIVET